MMACQKQSPTFAAFCKAALTAGTGFCPKIPLRGPGVLFVDDVAVGLFSDRLGPAALDHVFVDVALAAISGREISGTLHFQFDTAG
jgi:hypothetical protein